jgi:hypothetical protein
MRAIARLFTAERTGGSSRSFIGIFINRRALRHAGLAFTLILLFVSSSLFDAGAQPAPKIGAATAIENDVVGRLGTSVAKLNVGSEVFQNQFVRTGTASTANLQFMDETSLSLSPSTEIRLDRFVYEPGRKSGNVVLDVPRGVVRFITGTLESRSYTIKASFVTVGVRGTTFDVLVWPDRVTVLLVAGAVDLTARRRVYVLNQPGSAITIYRDGRVVGPRNWSGPVTDFANLAPPPTQRRAAAPPPQNTAAAPPSRASGPGTGVANTAIERLGAGSTINTVGGGGVGFAGGGRAAPCAACGPKTSGGGKSGGSAAGGPTGGAYPSIPATRNQPIDYGGAAPRPRFNPGDPK